MAREEVVVAEAERVEMVVGMEVLNQRTLGNIPRFPRRCLHAVFPNPYLLPPNREFVHWLYPHGQTPFRHRHREVEKVEAMVGMVGGEEVVMRVESPPPV